MSVQQTIVQLCPRLNSGGIERGTIDLAIALSKAGFNSIVISGGGFLVPELTAHHIEHIELPIYSKNPIVFIINLFRLAKLLRKIKPDIVHPRSRIPSWLVFFLRNRINACFVSSCNGIHSIDKFGLKKIYNGVLVKGDVVVVNSIFTKEYLLQNYHVNPEKIIINYRGIDDKKFKPGSISQKKIQNLMNVWNIDQHKIKIVLPARLSFHKGQTIFIQACHVLKVKFKLDFVAIIVGDTPNPRYLNELNTLIKQYGLHDSVKIVGVSQDMPSVYALADLVVSASTKPEAFGRTIVEAQAMGKLVLATNHGGATETIIDNKTGWLCPAGDAESMAASMFKILNLTNDEKQEHAQAAAAHVQTNFSNQRMCEIYIKLYRSLL